VQQVIASKQFIAFVAFIASLPIGASLLLTGHSCSVPTVSVVFLVNLFQSFPGDMRVIWSWKYRMAEHDLD
jgi:hypothetical protein